MAGISLSPPQIGAKQFYNNNKKMVLSFHELVMNNNYYYYYYNNNNNNLKGTPTKGGKVSSSRGRSSSVIRAYIENRNPISSFANKVIGSLPVVGLIARIVNDEGGVAGDIIDFAEFRRRVGNKCSVNDSRAFYEFQERRGRAGDPLYVLLCCWLAALGAGLLKSEEILEGVARLRLSNDIEFEEQTFMAKMTEAKERRAKVNGGNTNSIIPMEVRVEKAVDAIYVCCFDDHDLIQDQDQRLLVIMLSAVFPTVPLPEITRIVNVKAHNVAQGVIVLQDANQHQPQSLSKEAIRSQMKDLQFLKQNSTPPTPP